MRWITLIVPLVVTWGCAVEPREPTSAPFSLRPVALTPSVPPSDVTAIVALTSDRACVIDSFEVRILCAHRDSTGWRRWGREGDGPGELRRPLDLVRGPGGELGIVDGRSKRLTFFSTDGRDTTHVAVPIFFRPLDQGVTATAVEGLYEAFSPDRAVGWVARVSLERDSVIRNEAFRFPSSGQDMRVIFAGGLRVESGDYVFNVSNEHLVRHGSDGVFESRIRHTPFPPTPRTPEEIERGMRDLRRIFGREPGPEDIERVSAPEPPLLFGPPRQGPDGVFWVATTRGHRDSSHFELFRGDDSIGGVSVPGRLLSFDIIGRTLVAFVEKSSGATEEGFPPREIGWFEIVSDTRWTRQKPPGNQGHSRFSSASAIRVTAFTSRVASTAE